MATLKRIWMPSLSIFDGGEHESHEPSLLDTGPQISSPRPNRAHDAAHERKPGRRRAHRWGVWRGPKPAPSASSVAVRANVLIGLRARRVPVIPANSAPTSSSFSNVRRPKAISWRGMFWSLRGSLPVGRSLYKTEIRRERRNFIRRQIAGDMRHRRPRSRVIALAPLLKSSLQVRRR